MKPISNRFLGQAGVTSMLAGAVLLFAPGPTVASAKAAPKAAAPATTTCKDQPNLSYNGHQVLESYWFTIEHAGHTTTSCTIFGHVSEGDVVTAHFKLEDPAVSGAEISLVSYVAPGNAKHQDLFDCASFTVGGGGGDNCLSSNTWALTVDVPKCGFQVDLVYGEAISDLTLGDYGSQGRFISGQVDRSTKTCPTRTEVTPTPGGGGGTPVPSTGVSFDPASTGVLGWLMLLVGGGTLLYSVRRRTGDTPTP